MSVALQSLVGLTLIVAGAVAALPLLLGAPAPRPDPGAPDGGRLVRVVEAPGGRWFYRGEAVARTSLPALLQSGGSPQTVHYLPSAALTIAEVGASLRWLRRVSRGGAVLALPPAAEPPSSLPPATPAPARQR
ncbi:MAG: hypothetical protein ACKOZT_15230 [Cyanobium sp.]